MITYFSPLEGMSETACGIVHQILTTLDVHRCLEQEAIDGAEEKALETNDRIEEEGAYLWIYVGRPHPSSGLRITIYVSRDRVSIIFSRTAADNVQRNVIGFTYREAEADALAPGWTLDRTVTKASAELVRWVGDQQKIPNPIAEIKQERDPQSLRVHDMIASIINRQEPLETRI